MNPITAITGSRTTSQDPAAMLNLVYSVVSALLAAQRSIAVGCAAGVDEAAIRAVLHLQAAKRLTIFCAFGASGEGHLNQASAPLDLIAQAIQAGANVHFWAGGAPGLPGSSRGVPPAASRLVNRSLACINSAQSVVGFADSHPPKPFDQSSHWPSCGSGTWASLAAADRQGKPTVVFPMYDAGCLPQLLTPGAWQQTAAYGIWQASQRWMHC